MLLQGRRAKESLVAVRAFEGSLVPMASLVIHQMSFREEPIPAKYALKWSFPGMRPQVELVRVALMEYSPTSFPLASD
jgi:hypothetical protein